MDCLIVQRHLHFLSHFDATITAIAAERHRLDTGHLPTTLNDLVPKYLTAVPPDLFNAGKPLKYKIEADRFTVYSIGKNGLDEGGEKDTDAHPDVDDISFTILLPNAKRGVVQKRKPAEAE
jgi:hypothetical protein